VIQEEHHLRLIHARKGLILLVDPQLVNLVMLVIMQTVLEWDHVTNVQIHLLQIHQGVLSVRNVGQEPIAHMIELAVISLHVFSGIHHKCSIFHH